MGPRALGFDQRHEIVAIIAVGNLKPAARAHVVYVPGVSDRRQFVAFARAVASDRLDTEFRADPETHPWHYIKSDSMVHWRCGWRRGCSQARCYIPPLCGLRTRIRIKNSDFKPDVRALSFSVDLNREGQLFLTRRRPTGFLAAKRDDPAYKRRTRISGNHEAAYGIQPRRRLVVTTFQRQADSAEDPRVGPNAGTPDNQALSATALLE